MWQQRADYGEENCEQNQGSPWHIGEGLVLSDLSSQVVGRVI